jgi:hypothetical protein
MKVVAAMEKKFIRPIAFHYGRMEIYSGDVGCTRPANHLPLRLFSFGTRSAACSSTTSFRLLTLVSF